MNEQEMNPDLELFRDITGVMDVESWGYEGAHLVCRGDLKIPAGEAIRVIGSRIRSYSLTPFLQAEGGVAVLRLVPATVKSHKTRPLLHIALFLLTVVSTLVAWALVNDRSIGDIMNHPRVLKEGIPFSFSLLVILGFHELSHYVASKKHGLKVSLPYFIPFPNILGTMGAVIIGRSPFPDRKSLFDVGVAGPFAGFVLSVIALMIGLRSSEIIKPVITPRTFLIGGSFLFNYICGLHFPDIPYGYTYSITPMMFAGWVGMFVTALNLLPMGQLDGGHISYALFGRFHSLISKMTMGVLIFVGVVFYSPLWLVIVVFVALSAARHTPPLDDITPLDPPRVILSFFALLILFVCFIPVPLRALY